MLKDLLVEEVSMKWMDGPSVTEMDRGGVYEMDRQKKCQKNPAYGRQRISQPMRIVGPIQFWRGCMIYLQKKNKKNK